MSTLAEIETAAAALPAVQQRALIRFLTQLTKENSSSDQAAEVADLGDFSGSIRLAEDPLSWQQRIRSEW